MKLGKDGTRILTPAEAFEIYTKEERKLLKSKLENLDFEIIQHIYDKAFDTGYKKAMTIKNDIEQAEVEAGKKTCKWQWHDIIK